jgi:hypothetical protein
MKYFWNGCRLTLYVDLSSYFLHCFSSFYITFDSMKDTIYMLIFMLLPISTWAQFDNFVEIEYITK